MNTRMVLLCGVLAICIGLAGCQKIPTQAAPASKGLLPVQAAAALDSIPSEYGNLVGVTSSSAYPNWAQLWFEKPDKTIVVVRVNFIEGTLHDKVTTIPRR